MNMAARINIYGFLISAILLLAACYEDHGNYDYLSSSDVMPVEIEAIDSISVKANTELSITPTLSNISDDSDYSFLWYVLDSSYERDTLSDQRNLSVNVNLTVGDYTLYYKITYLETGVYKYITAPLTVTGTDITSGWYIMKEIDGGTDFDYFSLSGEHDQTNFLTTILGIDPMDGEPRSMMYQSEYTHEVEDEDGTTVETITALHLLSSGTYYALSGSDMTVVTDIDNGFYEIPDVIDMQYVEADDYSQYLINNGKLHYQGEIGRWGYQKAGDYYLWPDIFVIGSGFSLCFDYQNNDFYEVGLWADGMAEVIDYRTYTTFTEFADNQLTVSYVMNHTDETYYPEVYMIATMGDDKQNYVILTDFFLNYVYQTTYYEIPDDSPLLNSSVMAMPTSASVIYYADGNLFYLYRPSTGESRLLATMPDDEEIAFIKHVSGTEYDGTSFSDIVIITNSASSYYIYRFPTVGSAGEITVDTNYVMSGTGKASCLMFRQQ